MADNSSDWEPVDAPVAQSNASDWEPVEAPKDSYWSGVKKNLSLAKDISGISLLQKMGELNTPIPGSTLHTQKEIDENMAADDELARLRANSLGRVAYRTQNTRPGDHTPIEFDQGLPLHLREGASWETDPQKQAEYLQKQPGVLEARVGNGGNVIARMNDHEGKPRDFLLHPWEESALSTGSLAGSVGELSKLAVQGGIAAATGGAPLLVQMGITAGSGALLDAVPKGVSRLTTGQDLDPADLAWSGAKRGVTDASVLGALGLVGKGVGYLTGAGKTTPTAAAGVPAAKALALPVTPAMKTGSSAQAGWRGADADIEKGLALAKEPQTSGALPAQDASDVLSKTTEDLAQASKAKVDTSYQKAASDLESQIHSGVQKKILSTVNEAAAEAPKEVQSDLRALDAYQTIKGHLNGGDLPHDIPQSTGGAFTRQALKSRVGEFQNVMGMDYGAFYEGTDKVGANVPTGGKFSSFVESQQKQDPHGVVEQMLPNLKRIQGINTKLSGETKTAGGFSDNGLPLEDAVQPAAPMSIKQAVMLKAAINDHINFSSEIGNTESTIYKQAAKALSEDIDTALAKHPELADQYSALKSRYAEGATKFGASDVTKLLSDPQKNGAYVGDSEIIPRIFRGNGDLEALRSLKNAFGEGSPEYALAKWQGIKSLSESANNSIPADALLRKLDPQSGLSKEFVDELLGDHAQVVRESLGQLAQAQKGSAIPQEDLVNILQQPANKVNSLLKAAARSDFQHRRTFESSFTKDLRQGVFEPSTIKDDLWYDRVARGDTKEVRDWMQMIPAEQQEIVRKGIMQRILNDAEVPSASGKMPTERLRSSKLDGYLSPDNAEKYRAMVGDEGMKFLQQMRDYARMQEAEIELRPGGKSQLLSEAGDIGAATMNNERARARLLARGLQSAVAAGQKFEGVRNYFKTGELPQLWSNSTTRRAVLAGARTLPAAGTALSSLNQSPQDQ